MKSITFLLILFLSFFEADAQNSQDKKSGNLIIGSSLKYWDLSKPEKELFLKDFKYFTVNNANKQTTIHPNPKSWNWERTNELLKFAKKNKLAVRIHGPISPQASKWAKTDSRTKEELLKNLQEFMTATSKRYNKEPNVKWMDVVNETVLPNGKWFPAKEGTNKWENPWLNIGLDDNGYPIYISEAFKIATKYATNVKLVYNHNAGMQKVMWDKVKETILYVRSKGYRVDGVGWQGHMFSSPTTAAFAEDEDRELKKLADVIDWAHQNNLEFHVTELDYLLKDGADEALIAKKQAQFYRKLFKILEDKSKNGVVTVSFWNLSISNRNVKKGIYQSLYNKDYSPRPAYDVVKDVLNRNK